MASKQENVEESGLNRMLYAKRAVRDVYFEVLPTRHEEELEGREAGPEPEGMRLLELSPDGKMKVTMSFSCVERLRNQVLLDRQVTGEIFLSVSWVYPTVEGRGGQKNQ